MADFKGSVRYKERFGECRFDNDEGADDQRLTKAHLGGPPEPQKVDLTPFRDKRVKVSGDWQHDWIYEASISETDHLATEAGDALATERGDRLEI